MSRRRDDRSNYILGTRLSLPRPHHQRPICIVCGDFAVAAPSPTASPDLSVCREAHCRNVANRFKGMPPAQFIHYLSLQANLARSIRDVKQQLKDKAAAEADNEVEWWGRVDSLEAVRSMINPVKVVIPRGPNELLALSSERRQAHVSHLNSIIAEACTSTSLEMSSDNEIPSSETSEPLAGILCGHCRGGCCTAGGDTAYLSASTIRRVMSQNPEIHSNDLLERYTSQLPEQSLDNSCIYHTPKGCALPRESRSDVCNHYKCDALVLLLARPTDANGQKRPVLALQRRQDQWQQHTLNLNNDIISADLITEGGAVPVTSILPSEAGTVTTPPSTDIGQT